MTITETRSYNAFLATIGEILDQNSSAIGKAVSDKYVPATPPKTPEEESNKLNLVGQYWVKRYEFEEKRDIYVSASPGDKTKAKSNMIEAKYAALAAAAAASYPVPAGDELRSQSDQ